MKKRMRWMKFVMALAVTALCLFTAACGKGGAPASVADKETAATERQVPESGTAGEATKGEPDEGFTHGDDEASPAGPAVSLETDGAGNAVEAGGTEAGETQGENGETKDGQGAKPQDGQETKPQNDHVTMPEEQQGTKPQNDHVTKPQEQEPADRPAEPPQTPSDGNFSRTAIEVAKAMGDGINLGNTMEATAGGNPWFDVNDVTNWETAWGQPKTTQAMITGMKNAGFESIRIPISWSSMMAKDGSYKIPDVFFNRVDEIIGYAYANDMYVMINIHYDDGWWNDFATDEAGTMKRYKAMWSQIAEHYKNYDDKLIFESANEELGDALGYPLVNRINQTFVDIVRGSGGNNGVRYLLIAGYNTDIDKTCSSGFKMPADTCGGHLLISVHYYTPFTYCGLWKDESWGKADYDWGTDADKAEMENYFKKMQKFTEAGYGVIIGEYSVCPDYNGGNYRRKDGAVDFLSSVRRLSARYGYAAYLWDTGDWYDKAACRMRWSDTEDLYK